MARRFVTFAFVLLAASGMTVDATPAQDAIQRSFRGNAVHLDLSAGNYRITPSSDGRIRVTPRTNAEQVSTRITVNLLGTQATIRMVGPKSGFEAEIELPARVSVSVRGEPTFQWTGQGAHELRVRGAEPAHDTGKE
jgi:hypothetical protein